MVYNATKRPTFPQQRASNPHTYITYIRGPYMFINGGRRERDGVEQGKVKGRWGTMGYEDSKSQREKTTYR